MVIDVNIFTERLGLSSPQALSFLLISYFITDTDLLLHGVFQN